MAYTKDEAILFGKIAAWEALAEAGEYDSVRASLDAYRENVADTLADEESSEWVTDALAAFDAYIAAHQ